MWSQSCPEITQVVSKFYKVSQGCVNAMLSQSCIQVFRSCVKVVAKLSQSWPNIVLSCVKVVPKVSTNCPLSQSYLKVVPKSQNRPTVESKLSKSAYCALCMWCQVVSSGVHELRLPCGHDWGRAFDLADILLGKRSCQYIKLNVPCCFWGPVRSEKWVVDGGSIIGKDGCKSSWRS